MTLQKQISLFTGEELTSLQEASHASHTAWPENGREKTMSAICGPKCLGQFESYNRAGSWAKTFSALLIGTGDWYSTKCRLTWKLKGTKYNRMYFQLAPSTLPTDGTESGLWPTPNCVQRDRTEIAIKHREEGIPLYTRRDKAGTARQFSIVDYAVYKGLLPTPTVMDTNQGDLSKIDERRTRVKATGKNGNGFGATIGELANRRLLPTPMSQDGQNSTAPASQAGRDTLPGMVAATGTTSQLNPRFVLEMMGFPADWTELPFQNGETNP
jgi:hypothetical protein